MAAITVSAGTIELYQGAEATLKMRIYAKKNFTTSDLESIVRGRLHSLNFYREVEVTNNAGVGEYPQFVIDSTTDGTPNTSHYIFALYTNAGAFVGIVHKKIKVPPTPTSTTLGALQIFTSLTPISITDAYYNALVALIEAMMRATVDVYGVARSSYAAAAAGNPIHVENNDPIIRSERENEHLEFYGQTQAGVTAAIAAIGSTLTRLKVSKPVLVSSNSTFHANTIIEIEGHGSFSVNPGNTLTLTLDPATNDLTPMASGAGSVRFRNPRIKFGWLAEAGLTNHNWAYDQCEASMIANGGGDLLMNSGAWYLAGQLIPANSKIYGCGNDVDSDTGTRIVIQDLAATSVLGVSGAYRGAAMSRLSINRLTSTSARSFWARGTYPDSGFTSRHSDVTFCTGEAVTSVPVVEYDSLPGASTWETISNYFDQCCLFVGAGQTGFACDTTNSNFTWTQGKFWGGVGTTIFKLASCGWMEINGTPDWRRIPGAVAIDPPTTTTDRTVTGTVTAVELELSVGQFVENDLGQQVFLTGLLNRRIIDILSPTIATLSGGADGDVVDEIISIKYFNDNPTLSECCIEVTGSLNGLTVQGGCDEGFNYFLKTSNPTLFGEIRILGATVQSKIHMAGSRTLKVKGCTLAAQTFSDESGVDSHLFLENEIHDGSLIGAYSGEICDLVRPRNWGIHDGGSVIHYEKDIWTGAPSYGHGVRDHDRYNITQRIVNGKLQVGSDDPVGNTQIEIGQWDKFLEVLLNKYTFGRDNDPDEGNGALRIFGSQTTDFRRYLGLRTNFDASFTTLNTEEETTAFAADGMLITDTRAFLQRLTGTGTIWGLVSQPYDGGFRPGELKLLYNAGSGTLTLQHESASAELPSPDDEMTDGLVPEIFRFFSGDGYDQIMSPGDFVLCIHDETAVRWLPVHLGPSKSPKQRSKAINYTLVRGDADATILHPVADDNARTYTIPANASVPFPVGAEFSIVNEINTITIPITSDTLILAGAGTTGTRTLAANGIAFFKKTAATRWYVWGEGIT